MMTFQSTRPMRGATVADQLDSPNGAVSIHAPHAGRDFLLPSYRRRRTGFNPRAPCGARRPFAFSPTPVTSFNPRAPCGARRPVSTSPIHDGCFNPRAPCGARRGLREVCEPMVEFQSTRPMRGATRHVRCLIRRKAVSIHAPHAGRDCTCPCQSTSHTRFNPRAPCGARRV